MKRHQYEDVVISSAPTRLVIFYVKHYLKIIFGFFIFYVTMGYMMVSLDMMRMTTMEQNQFFLSSAQTTQEFEVFQQLNDLKNYEYVDDLDKKRKSASSRLLEVKSEHLLDLWSVSGRDDSGVDPEIINANDTIEYEMKWLHRNTEPIEIVFSDLAIIFECKDDCRTIIDVAHIKEM